MQCKNCGNELGEGNNFCPKCGSGQIVEVEQVVGEQKTTATSETDSVESSKGIIREENKEALKNPVNWIFVFVGLAVQVMTDGYCCHFFNIEWLTTTASSLLGTVVVAGIIAAIFGKRGENGKMKINFRTFSITLLIFSVVLLIGKFAKH